MNTTDRKRLEAERGNSDTFSAWLRTHASEFFEGFDDGPMGIENTGIIRRPSANLYRFRIQSAQGCERVIVKERPSSAQKPFPAHEGRWALFVGPAWVLPPEFESRCVVECEALGMIEKHFGALGDARFDTVRPIGTWVERATLAMVDLAGEPLSARLSKRAPRNSRPSAEAEAALLHACGAWLQQFHELPAGRSRPIHHDDRESVLGALAATASALPARSRLADPLRTFCAKVSDAIAASLPKSLPIGLVHGDFWAGNVIVQPSGAIAIIDTFAAWQAPIYQDLGYFLFQLKVAERGWIQLMRFRPDPRVDSQERHFLQGYFGDHPILWRTVRLFEACALIRRWAARLHSSQRSKGPTRVLKWAGIAARTHFFAAYADWLIARVEGADGEEHP